MINIDKFNSEFDINNIDPKKILLLIDQHKNTFIKTVLVVATLMIVGMILADHNFREAGLRTKISLAQKKIQAIKARDAAVANFNNFEASLPQKLSEVELIAFVSEAAKLYNIVFNSLSPAESKDEGIYDIINLKLSATTGNFKDMMLFLRKLEKSGYPLRIDSWSGREGIDGKIVFEIKINEVIIHP